MTGFWNLALQLLENVMELQLHILDDMICRILMKWWWM